MPGQTKAFLRNGIVRRVSDETWTLSCSGAARFESAAATGLPSPRTTGSSTMSSSQGGDQPGKGVKGMFGRLKNGCRLGDRKKGYEKVIRVNLNKTS